MRQYYSTINRRVNILDIEFNEHIGNDIVIALDSTGIKVANHGEWMRHKWHAMRRISYPLSTLFIILFVRDNTNRNINLVHLNTAFFAREPHLLHEVSLTLLPQTKHA